MGMLTWSELFPPGSFRDDRLRERARILLHAMMEMPGGTFGQMFGKGSSPAKRAYDFCENDRNLSLDKILLPARWNLGQALRLHTGPTILCVQDTSELALSHLSMTGLGEIGNPDMRGLFFHCGLAVATDGLTLGLLSALTWARPPEQHGKAASRHDRPLEAKESVKWWRTIENAEATVNRPKLLLHVADREADIFDVLARADASGFRYLVRAAQDRRLCDAEQRRLWAQAESWPMAGHHLLDVPFRPPRNGKPARPQRCAELSIRFGRVRIAQPDSHGFLELNVVLVREEQPPEGEEPIEWLLLTNDPVEDAAAAWQAVEYYRLRWRIEEFHNCIKTTCRAERRQFEDRAHYEIFFALILLVSARILFLRDKARLDPELPAQVAFDSDELAVLRAHHDAGAKQKLPDHLSIHAAVRLVAMLGGFLARKGDGEPGFKTLALGYSKLRAMTAGYRLARGLPESSHPMAISLPHTLPP
jgi:hypothetical protein